MGQIETAPQDLDTHVSLLRAFVRRDATTRAEPLLHLLLETLDERGLQDARTRLVQRLAGFWPDAATVLALVRADLEARYRDAPSFENLLEQLPLTALPDPLEAAARLERWLRFDVGTVVYAEALGTGIVTEVRPGLGSLRLQFEATGKLETFRIEEAEKLLTPLAAGHFLRRKRDDPEALRALAATAPGEVLAALFESMGPTLTTTEIKKHLDGIVDASTWASWWKKAREDPRLTVGPGSRPRCTWSASADAADALVAAQFEAASTRERLDLARQHASRHTELAAQFAATLAADLPLLVKRDPAAALETALVLDALPVESPEASRRLAALLQHEDAVTWLAAIRDRPTRERGILELRRRRDDWPQSYARLLFLETDPRTLTFLYEALQEHGDAAVRETAIRDVLLRPGAAPRWFLWLCREMSRRDELAARADAPLLRRLLQCLDDDAFKGVRGPLRELFEPGGLVSRIAATLDDSAARQVLDALEREVGLETHRRDALRDLIVSTHPHLDDTEDEVLYATAEALERKRAEFEKLVREEIPRNTEEIRKAAAHGDLRENFEYKAARERQEMLSSRAKSLHDDLGRARVLDPASIQPDVVRVGTRVVLTPESGDPIERTLLGPWDSDPDRGVLSYLAPAVAPLLGRAVGDRVTFAGQEVTITRIEVWRTDGSK